MHEDRPIRMREPTKTLKESRAFQGLNYQNHLPDCYTWQNTCHNWKGKKLSMMKKTEKFISTKPVHRQYWKESKKDKNIDETRWGKVIG